MTEEILIAYAEGMDIETLMRVFDLYHFEIEVIILAY
jgi:hypothetical protein